MWTFSTGTLITQDKIGKGSTGTQTTPRQAGHKLNKRTNKMTRGKKHILIQEGVVKKKKGGGTGEAHG